MIENIAIEKIFPHPDNPRKKLGDLGELEESIRTFGVLQNLTVVPHKEHKGAYTVVCGHRRLEAAKKAGLAELPCSIVDMDERTQLSTMLMENMQRSDLTPQEEAQGFQMILNLGGSVADIVKDTGLSETKIRHRIKLNELDQKILGEKMQGVISIKDLIKLEQIKDLRRRNKCLEKIGTNNFDYEVQAQIRAEQKEYVEKRLAELLPDAEFTGNWSQYPSVCYLPYDDAVDAEIEKFTETLKEESKRMGAPIMVQIGCQEATGRIKKQTTADRNSTASNTEWEKKQREREDRRERLDDMKNRMIERIQDFLAEKSEMSLKTKQDIILPFAAGALLERDPGVDESEMLELLGWDPEDIDGMNDKDIASEFNLTCQELPRKVLLIEAVMAKMPKTYEHWWSYEGEYIKSDSSIKDMMDTYGILGQLGFMAADEELDFLAGDSDLYLKEE